MRELKKSKDLKNPNEFRTVLLVEHIQSYRFYIESALKGSEFKVVSVPSAEATIQVVKRMTPHILLVEDNLPSCDIERFLLKLREIGLESPIIIMSTKGDPEHIRKYAYLFVSDFLVKPIEEERLLRSLRNAGNPECTEADMPTAHSKGTARVLIADDIGASRRMLGAHLEKSGFSFVEAKGGVDAVSQVISGDVDIMLLDYKMKDMDGLEVLQELKARNKSVPTYMVSAHATPEVVAEARTLGAIDFFRKPIDVEDLTNRLNDMAGSRKS